MTQKRRAAPERQRLPGDAPHEDRIARMIPRRSCRRVRRTAYLCGPAGGAGARTLGRCDPQNGAAGRRTSRPFRKTDDRASCAPDRLHPLWHLAGFALGAATAALGEKAAMACTVAVEETIVAHYGHQLAALGVAEPALRKHIAKCKDDEDHHRATGLKHGAEDLPYYPLLRALIRAGSHAAIWLSERV